jgi:hypothetical protein
MAAEDTGNHAAARARTGSWFASVYQSFTGRSSMPRAITEQPPTGPAAFAQQSDAAYQAQAAILLSVGLKLRGDDVAAVSQAMAASLPPVGAVPDEFPVPAVPPAAGRVHLPALRVEARRAGMGHVSDIAQQPESGGTVALSVYLQPSVDNAALLADSAMHHDDLLVKVAGANAALAVTTDPAQAIEILTEGVRSDDELVRDVAATTLARYAPENPFLRELLERSGPTTPEAPPSQTSMLVHGTWAKSNTWWQPGGDFHTFLKQGIWTDLYSSGDRYDWSGGYSDGARAVAGTQLVDWIHQHNEDGLSLMTHSHGGSVAMLASWQGVHFKNLVLLSCPVHPSKYNVNFNAVVKVTSIRVRMDLVLLADGSGTHFNDPRYNDHVLPVWFNHSATHDPNVWNKYKIPQML